MAGAPVGGGGWLAAVSRVGGGQLVRAAVSGYRRMRHTDARRHAGQRRGGGAEGTGSRQASISADGRFVAFESAATDLVASDTNGLTDVFVHDRMTGQTTRVSVDSASAQAMGGNSAAPAISADGRFVAFDSLATNLVAGDGNGFS